MKQEHSGTNGKQFPADAVANETVETLEKQPPNGSALRQIGGEGSVSGEFSFQNYPVRTLTQSGEAWFWGAEICRGMGIRNSRQALSCLEDDEKGVTIIDTNGGPQTVSLISESGLYALAMTTRKPQALAFRRWVTKEVLPAIRKTGFYSLNASQAHLEGAIMLPPPDRPTRFVVMAVPGRTPHVRQTEVTEAVAEFKSLDLQGLCYALKTIEVWWQKVQIKASLRPDHDDGFAFAQLERAIATGAMTVDQYLGRGDDP